MSGTEGTLVVNTVKIRRRARFTFSGT